MSAVAVVVFSCQIALTVTFARIWYVHLLALVACCAVSVIASAAQVRILGVLSKECKLIVQAFELQGLPWTQRLSAHLQSRRFQVAQSLNICICIWHVVCLVSAALVPPCNTISRVYSWRVDAAELPCVTWELCCTSSLVLDYACGLAFFVMLGVVDTQETPAVIRPNRAGLPSALIGLLPISKFSGSALLNEGRNNVSSNEVTCQICIDDFAPGTLVRKLPCGHSFHATCVDTWLSQTASCPLRCHVDIWQHARGIEADVLPIWSPSWSGHVSA